ncbi:MAG: MATE family efflux transporter [Edaphobacter sp.]|uniref:MATE family efflux transporter n=1 Tax=Edaphobacter sp. TaxID=1934404 RepID=UPI00238E8D77|nr:MATE family efflux transporter [Edaphobacter sp.]MDE1178773.1 MATE family efflux transporter [Edaphobacter sp.]
MAATMNALTAERRAMLIEGPIGRALFKLALPITLGQILQTGYQLTDAFWVGRLGASAVAAVAVSFPVTFLIIALGSGLAIAGATLSAQYMGAGNQKMVDHVAGQTMLMVAVTSTVLGGAGFAVAPFLLHKMAVAPDVYHDALGFLRVSFVSIVFVFGYAMFQALMRGVGETRIPLLIVLGTVLMNFALDPLFIFGWGPIAGHGVMGAAMATAITQGLAVVIGIVIFARGKHGIHLHWNELRPDPTYIRRAFALGLPGSVELSTRGLSMVVLSFFAAGFGTLTTAAYGVGSSILQVVIIPAMGISIAVSTLVGQNIGAGKTERASRVAVLGAVASFLGLTVVGVLAWVFAPHIVGFFVPHDAEVIAQSAHFVRIISLAWGLIGVQFCFIAVFRACGNTVMAMTIALVSQWLVQFPTLYILSKHTSLHADGMWWSFPVSNIAGALISGICFAAGGWKKKRLTDEEELKVAITDEEIVEEGLR